MLGNVLFRGGINLHHHRKEIMKTKLILLVNGMRIIVYVMMILFICIRSGFCMLPNVPRIGDGRDF